MVVARRGVKVIGEDATARDLTAYWPSVSLPPDGTTDENSTPARSRAGCPDEDGCRQVSPDAGPGAARLRPARLARRPRPGSTDQGEAVHAVRRRSLAADPRISRVAS